MGIFRKQNGDTIVEVLIAMTVIAGVLGASYTVVNRTMANARQAQEHTEALQVANKQIEYITTLMASSKAADLIASSGYNCADKNTGEFVTQTINSPDDTPDKYAPACVSDGSVQYLTAFKYVTNAADANNGAVKYFKVFVTWPSVTGNGNDHVTLAYRAYQP